MNTAADSEHVVLIVDDEEMIVRLLCHQLANVPATVVPTSSPAEAIHILQTREVAVLLCDLNMPRIEGPAVLAVAREEQPNIVSIVVTGGADPSATMKAINDGGIWKYIAKPWQQEELVALVCEALEHYNNLLHQQKQLEKLARQIKADTQKVAEESGRRQVRISKKTGKSLKKTAPGKTPSESKPPSTIQKKQIRIRKTQHGEEKAPKDETSTTCKKKQIRIVKKGSAAPETPEQDPHQADRDLFAESRYILGDYLGCGPFGCVYEAEDKLLNQPVAIKLLAPEAVATDEDIQLLKEGARIAMQLTHKHIVRLHSFQELNERFCLVMEHVDGRSFRDVHDTYGQLPVGTVMQVIKVCGETLSHAHSLDILHLNLKPTNLLLTEEGKLKISDFGLSNILPIPETEAEANQARYMSPEQISGMPVDEKGDIYSVGLILYELLTGHLPFSSPKLTLGILRQGANRFDDLPEPLRPAMQKALDPNPYQRWDSIGAFARELMIAGEQCRDDA